MVRIKWSTSFNLAMDAYILAYAEEGVQLGTQRTYWLEMVVPVIYLHLFSAKLQERDYGLYGCFTLVKFRK